MTGRYYGHCYKCGGQGVLGELEYIFTVDGKEYATGLCERCHERELNAWFCMSLRARCGERVW